LGYTNTSDLASVEVSNDTSYGLTVRYSGRDSQKHVIPPKQKRTFRIRKGEYRVTATVDAGSVRPYAGSEKINYDQYGVSFYIITTRF
jgi:P pilus assembly chaperone PapD